MFLWHPLFVTWTGKEAQSKSKDKAKEETILPKCNVIVHHPSSQNLWSTEDYNQTKKDFSNSSNASTKASNSLRGDQEESGMQPFSDISGKIIGNSTITQSKLSFKANKIIYNNRWNNFHRKVEKGKKEEEKEKEKHVRWRSW